MYNYVTAWGASLILVLSSMSQHTIIVPLVFRYTIVGPLELDLGHKDETNRHSVLQTRRKGKELQPT